MAATESAGWRCRRSRGTCVEPHCDGRRAGCPSGNATTFCCDDAWIGRGPRTAIRDVGSGGAEPQSCGRWPRFADFDGRRQVEIQVRSGAPHDDARRGAQSLVVGDEVGGAVGHGADTPVRHDLHDTCVRRKPRCPPRHVFVDALSVDGVQDQGCSGASGADEYVTV